MPDYDDLLYIIEPIGRMQRRKYKFYKENNLRKLHKKHSTILLSSVSAINERQENDNSISSSLAGSCGHKPSFKSTKLARRARSFKDDFLGKIMRTPAVAGTVLRAHSPKDRLSKPDPDPTTPTTTPAYALPFAKRPEHELANLWKQTQATLNYFRDVVAKQKLEMLPGNGTIVLDTVWQINLAVKSSSGTAEYSSSIISATHHMYQSVARLIKLCDDALIDDKSAELTIENVNEIVGQVEAAVQKLIQLAQEKLVQQRNNHNSKQKLTHKTTPRSSYANTSLDISSTQRNSLPDIPLTPCERQLLESNSYGAGMVRSSHSSESILRDGSPPPKPPLPERVLFGAVSNSKSNSSCVTPPPLPPKKKHHKYNRFDDESFGSDKSPTASSLERFSIRSKSPEDSSSLLSASAGSLDSVLNNSRGDYDTEITAIMGDNDVNLENHTSDICGANGLLLTSWDDQSGNTNISNQNFDQLQSYHRLSNNTTDSGMGSYRSSIYSKRSSQQSSNSSQWGTTHQTSSSSSAATTTTSNIVQKSSNDGSLLTIKNYNQKTSSSSSSSSLVSTIMTSGGDGDGSLTIIEVNPTGEDGLVPPAIPEKTRKKTDRQPSPYDNVPGTSLGGEVLITCQMHQSQQSFSSNTSQESIKPPPLPPKKKHIMAYMEMFGNCSHNAEQEFMRHSMHIGQTEWSTQTPSAQGLPTTQSCSFSHKSHTSSSSRSTTHTQINVANNSQLNFFNTDSRATSPMHSPSSETPTNAVVPPALPPKQRFRLNSAKSSPPPSSAGNLTIPNDALSSTSTSPAKVLPDLLEHTTTSTTTQTNNSISPNKSINSIDENEDNKSDLSETNVCNDDLMEELNVDKWLVWKKADEDGPDIRGGTVDALIIQATKTKNGVFAYQEAFLTTYRTFISPCNLIKKLIRRYEHFHCQPTKKSRATEAFALIVRVVSDLTVSDLDNDLQYKLMNFIQQLISNGDIILAKALRVKHLERHEARMSSVKQLTITTSLSLHARNVTLLDFKSEQVAEQMTLLDSELFTKIEIPEVLIWVQEQNEERSPNLTQFTEHFNKMSYWARTKILTTEVKDVREKYFMKFIKIMKHLRKINNFNSYLALLSALDSAPIRRLEWQKQVQEGLKEYCALIDSSSSFRAYRQALAETQPPCIPYIGIVLQDLTFVHIGNSNLLNDGKINFSKRWQQYNIVENMKKFKKDTHSFKRNDRIISFFQNFDEIIGEDAMWQLSETIKPRKKTTS